MTDLTGAKLLLLRRGREKRIDSSVGEQLHRGFSRTRRDPVDVLIGVEPDVRHHKRDVKVRTRAQHLGDCDFLAPQIANGSYRLVREQLEPARMHTRQHRDRHAGIQAIHGRCCEIENEIDFAASDQLCGLGADFART
jgi:hypothetical protein